jgi:hypothetical protein
MITFMKVAMTGYGRTWGNFRPGQEINRSFSVFFVGVLNMRFVGVIPTKTARATTFSLKMG